MRSGMTFVNIFLSTPSGWRATEGFSNLQQGLYISIHALRVEGDDVQSAFHVMNFQFLSTPSGWRATYGYSRESTEAKISIHALRVEGDLILPLCKCRSSRFLSTPSGWRATMEPCISTDFATAFLSTPSGWRATANTDKVFVCFCAKGRRICLFKTRKEKICRWRFKKDKFWVLIWCEGSGKSVCALASHCG